MKNIIDNFYFEESSGFMYEKKTFNGAFYYVPLNFCILEYQLKCERSEQLSFQQQLNLLWISPIVFIK